MYLSMVLLFGIAVFVTQLVFCIYAKKRWIKLLPICTVGALELLCIGCFFLGKALHMEDSLSFAAFIFGYVGCYWALAAAIAWGIYCIVKLVQKRRKTFVM